MARKYYAGRCGYGIDVNYDCGAWEAYVFASKKGRDAWVNEMNEKKIQAEPITRATALRISDGEKTIIRCADIETGERNREPMKNDLLGQLASEYGPHVCSGTFVYGTI